MADARLSSFPLAESRLLALPLKYLGSFAGQMSAKRERESVSLSRDQANNVVEVISCTMASDCSTVGGHTALKTRVLPPEKNVNAN